MLACTAPKTFATSWQGRNMKHESDYDNDHEIINVDKAAARKSRNQAAAARLRKLKISRLRTLENMDNGR